MKKELRNFVSKREYDLIKSEIENVRLEMSAIRRLNDEKNDSLMMRTYKVIDERLKELPNKEHLDL